MTDGLHLPRASHWLSSSPRGGRKLATEAGVATADRIIGTTVFFLPLASTCCSS